MTLILNDDDVRASIEMGDLVDALRLGLRHESRGALTMPPRLNVRTGSGAFLRLMPAVLPELDLMGYKVFNGSGPAGVRYLMALYRMSSGELLALMDACHLTSARTGATTGVAAGALWRDPSPVEVGVIGSGVEARTNLEGVLATCRVTGVRAFSPDADRLSAYAAEVRSTHGIDVTACASAAEAAACPIVLVATNTGLNSNVVALRAEWLPRASLVLTIGSTMPGLREVDARTFADADVVLDTMSAIEESGDIIAAYHEGTWPHERVTTLASAVDRPPASGNRVVFKSVGTAMQDVLAAAVVYDRAIAASRGATASFLRPRFFRTGEAGPRSQSHPDREEANDTPALTELPRPAGPLTETRATGDSGMKPFAIGTFDAGRGRFPAVIRDEREVIDATAIAPTVRAMFENWHQSFEQLAELAESGLGAVPIEHLKVLHPIEPRQIIQAGANYYEHVLQLIVAGQTRAGADREAARAEGAAIMDARVAHGEPYLFLGAVGAICGPYDDVVLPERGSEHDWELELACVIGADGEVAAYTIANDISTRDLIYRDDLKGIGTDWLRGKNAPTFLPLGPSIVPAQFVGKPEELVITLSLNGEVMQQERTADMIFPIERLLAYAHQHLRVLPGDLLLTGSPAGNGSHYNRFLLDGDVMESTITGLGVQRNRCVAASAHSAADAPTS